MDDFIKREAAIAIIEEKQKELCPVGRYGRGYVYGSDREKYDAWDEIIDALENIPSADVVPVVRCKDCRYRGLICCPTMHETMGSGLLDCAVDDGYCWCGKPKEGTTHA